MSERTGIALIIGAAIVIAGYFMSSEFVSNNSREQAIAEESQNTELRKQAITECEGVLLTTMQIAVAGDLTQQQKQQRVIAVSDKWNNGMEEDCIQDQIKKWKGK